MGTLTISKESIADVFLLTEKLALNVSVTIEQVVNSIFAIFNGYIVLL